MENVLICYYSDTDSTKEVAEYIYERMEKEACQVSIKPLDAVSAIQEYTTVIIGAPIKGLRWEEHAVKFIADHIRDFETIKTVYFALGILVYKARPFFQKKAFKALEKPSKMVMPIESAVFGGVNNEDLPNFFRKVFGLPKNLAKDQRDWNLIKEWTDNLIKQMK